MASDSPRKRLPFEPSGAAKGQGKPSNPSKSTRAGSSSASRSTQADGPKVAAAKSAKANQGKSIQPTRSVTPPVESSPVATAIPEVVSRRMLRRMLVFSGIPTLLGVLTFFVSYFLVVKAGVELPSYAVLFTTLGWFGLGVLGLTYGVLSASWDEDRVGGRLGLAEFKVNFSRMTGAWGSRTER